MSKLHEDLQKYVKNDAIVHPYFVYGDTNLTDAAAVNSAYLYTRRIAEKLKDGKDWKSFLSLLGRQSKCEFLVTNMDQIDVSEYFELVGDVWNTGYCSSCFLTNCLTRSQQHEYRKQMMSHKEILVFESLSSTELLFRSHGKDNQLGCSWTLSKKVAMEFAKNFGRNYISEIRVPRAKIVAYFGRKEEFECIVSNIDINLAVVKETELFSEQG